MALVIRRLAYALVRVRGPAVGQQHRVALCVPVLGVLAKALAEFALALVQAAAAVQADDGRVRARASRRPPVRDQRGLGTAGELDALQ